MHEHTEPHDDSHTFSTVAHYFESNNFRFHMDPESQVVQFFVSGDCLVRNCTLQRNHDGELIKVWLFGA
jgi:hypothetical protein